MAAARVIPLGGNSLIRHFLKNGVRTVIIEGMDRLARELRVQEHLVIYLASKDIALISARTEEDVTAAVMGDPMKKALVQIQGVFAELEKSLLVKKLRTARERIRKKPDQRRMTYAQIAARLNEDGHRTVSGKAWTAANVQTIVKRF